MSDAPALTAEEQQALDDLVPHEQQTGDLRADLAAAARETWRRREQNTHDGAQVLGALYRTAGSWRAIETETGIPRMTAWRWAVPPQAADADRPEVDPDR